MGSLATYSYEMGIAEDSRQQCVTLDGELRNRCSATELHRHFNIERRSQTHINPGDREQSFELVTLRPVTLRMEGQSDNHPCLERAPKVIPFVALVMRDL